SPGSARAAGSRTRAAPCGCGGTRRPSFPQRADPATGAPGAALAFVGTTVRAMSGRVKPVAFLSAAGVLDDRFRTPRGSAPGLATPRHRPRGGQTRGATAQCHMNINDSLLTLAESSL